MESIVKFLEKGQPYFDKVSKNIYLQAIKDGFLAAMPIILSSSVFLLISTLPGVVATVGGFTLPDWWNVDVVNFCNKVYNFTMGVVGIMVAGTTASALTGSKNRRMPAGKAINATSTMVAAMCAMLILAVTQTSAKIDGADVSVFFTDNMGTKGLLSSFVAAFATVNIYAFCIKRDITIKLPKEVPGAIAQNFRDIFAFSFSILFVAVIDVICRTCLAVPFANVISTLVSPLFAAPIILNPYFLIPFLFAPVANVLIGKFFIDFLGMNGFIYAMPWALPGPIGTFIDTNFQPISLVLVVVLLVVDFLIYYPFCKAYDNVLCKQEAETLAEEEAEETKAVKTAAAPAVEAPVVETASATEASAAPSALKGKDLRVLVLCAGAGTSALLANALKEGADELGIDITANAGAYGSHYAIMDQYNVIVLAPQVRTYYNEMKADTDRLGITLLSPKGKQYIDLTKDPKGAVAWIEENLEA